MILITEWWGEVGDEGEGTLRWERGSEERRMKKSVHPSPPPPVILEIVTYIEFWSLSMKFKPKCIVYPGDYGVNTPWAFEFAFASIHNSMRIYYRSKQDKTHSLSSTLAFPPSLRIPKRFMFHPNLKIATILIVIETNWQIMAKMKINSIHIESLQLFFFVQQL